MVLHVFQYFLAFFLDVAAAVHELCPGCIGSFLDFLLGDVWEFLFQRGADGAYIRKGHERIAEVHFAAADLLHVVADVLRIGGDDGAVVVVVSFVKFRALIEERRIEDEVHSLFDQPHDVAVRYFGRVAGWFARDRLDAHLIHLVGGEGRSQRGSRV